MNHYMEVAVLPDPDFTPAIVLGALFGRLHRALVELRADDIGVSFPQYQEHVRDLGTSLRMHGTIERLTKLNGLGWTQGVADHITVSALREVPSEATHRVVRRRQFKTSAERLRRRRMRRHGETHEEAKARIPEEFNQTITTPFLTIRSVSTSQSFALFVEHGPIAPAPVAGTFSTYGLSPIATVPWF